MLILSNTTDKIQISLAVAVTTSQLSCISIYRDTDLSSITPLRTLTSTNNTTLVDLVPAPSSSTYRSVDFISVYNDDTVSAEVTIEFSDNGTNYTLFKCRLASTEKVEYHEGFGFRVISNDGALKTSTIVNSKTDANLNSIVLREDIVNLVTTANASISVPELKFVVDGGKKYWFRFILFYTSDATTTGSRWYLYGPSAEGLLSFQVYNSLTTTSQTLGIGAAQYEYITTSNATSAATGGNTAIIEGFLYADSDDEVFLRFSTEAAGGTITLKKNSLLHYRQAV